MGLHLPAPPVRQHPTRESADEEFTRPPTHIAGHQSGEGVQQQPVTRGGGKQRKQALEQRKQTQSSSRHFAHGFVSAAGTPTFGILLVFDDRTPTIKQALSIPPLAMTEPLVWLPTYNHICAATRYMHKPKNQCSLLWTISNSQQPGNCQCVPANSPLLNVKLGVRRWHAERHSKAHSFPSHQRNIDH
jgi:hypothetical protein